MLRRLQLDCRGLKVLQRAEAEKWSRCLLRVTSIAGGRVAASACVSATCSPSSESLATAHYKTGLSKHFHRSSVSRVRAKWNGSCCGATVSPLVIFRTFVSESGRKQVVPFNLSDIGEGIAEVLVKEWYVQIGQRVNQFDSICEVQSDKASVTITSKFDGVIKRIYYSVDETAKVGQPLVDIEIDAQSSETSNQLIDEIDDQDACDTWSPSSRRTEHSLVPGSAASPNLDSYKRTLATPAVRRLATLNSINLSDVRGTGKDGRVMKEDLLAHIDRMKQVADEKDAKNTDHHAAFPQQDKVQASQSRALPQQSQGVSSVLAPPTHQLTRDQSVKVSSVTRGMIKSMTASLAIPHLALADEVNVGKLLQMKQLFEKVTGGDTSDASSVRITLLPIFLKALSLALSRFPLLNSQLSESREEITYIARHNIGFAMDTPVGLLVPNIKSVEKLSIYEIALEVNRLMQVGSRGQLSTEDLVGGTFTLSNIGSIGGSFGVPVIMPPQVAIGALGRIQSVPRFASPSSDQIVRASVLQVVWTADHRIIDGATVARFSEFWKSLLEEPVRMSLHLR